MIPRAMYKIPKVGGALMSQPKSKRTRTILESLWSTGRPQTGDQSPSISRLNQTISFDVRQDGNSINVQGDGIDVVFSVEGVALPRRADPSFAVWGLLQRAMEEGFNLHINEPVDPRVAANAEQLSQVWEMWAPNHFRSIKVTSASGWSRGSEIRKPRVHLYSGGVDSTYSLLKDRLPDAPGYAVTVCGVDQTHEGNFPSLLDKTAPLLDKLNYERISVWTNAQRNPPALTHGFTLAASAFLLSDLFVCGTLAADSTLAEDMATFPWGTNHVTNEYFAGSDFFVQSAGADSKRTEKIAALVDAGIDPTWLSFCRKAIPANCGTCGKCIRTKAMFLVATGNIPNIFVNNRFDYALIKEIGSKYAHRVHLFDIYHCAKNRGMLDKFPGLENVVEQSRLQAAAYEALHKPRNLEKSKKKAKRLKS